MSRDDDGGDGRECVCGFVRKKTHHDAEDHDHWAYSEGALRCRSQSSHAHAQGGGRDALKSKGPKKLPSCLGVQTYGNQRATRENESEKGEDNK